VRNYPKTHTKKREYKRKKESSRGPVQLAGRKKATGRRITVGTNRGHGEKKHMGGIPEVARSTRELLNT